MNDDLSFDYVVVGAGSAGCVVASRLSEDPQCKILLIEAGEAAAHKLVDAPGAARFLEDTTLNWGFRSTPQPFLNNRRIDLPRGRALGGSGQINWSYYVRGNRGDYDHWAQSGNQGWDYDSVLPYFRRAETNATFHDDWHGADGPLSVENLAERNPLQEIYFEALDSLGVPANPDFNGGTQEGYGYYQGTIRNGKRWSTADAYLTPALKRPNLTVETGAVALRIVLAGSKIVGVDFLDAEQKLCRATAGIEVICCAGAIGSPHLLMISGFGPANHLEGHSIRVIADLPGVGHNLLDHIGHVSVGLIVSDPDTFGLQPQRFEKSIEQFDTHQSGPLATMHGDAGGFVRLRPTDDYPGAQLYLFLTSGAWLQQFPFPTAFLNGYAARTHSKGRVKLASAHPLDRPIIDPKYFSDPDDLERLIEVVQFNWEVANAKPFDAVRGGFIKELGSRESIVLAIQEMASTTWHQTSTCRMGTDVDAVVGPDLKVRGVEGLRAGLFNANYLNLYLISFLKSIAFFQSASAMFVSPFARMMLRAKLRALAKIPGFDRMRLASSSMVTSRT